MILSNYFQTENSFQLSLNQKVIDYAFENPCTGTMGYLLIICIQRCADLKGSVVHLVEMAWFDSNMLDNLIAWLQSLTVKNEIFQIVLGMLLWGKPVNSGTENTAISILLTTLCEIPRECYTILC